MVRSRRHRGIRLGQETSDSATLLAEKVAVVTGGGAGIGGAISRVLAAQGAAVAVAEIDPERAAAAVQDIAARGGRATSHVVDVREPEDVQRLAEEVVERHGRVDVLVNNVGDYLKAVPFLRSQPDHWDDLYLINLHHVFLVTRAFLPGMV